MITKNIIAHVFADYGVAISTYEIQEKIDEFSRFKVQDFEVWRAVIRYFMKEKGMKPYDSNEDIVDEPNGKWIDIQAKVVQVWKINSDSIFQAGIVCDGRMSINFFVWECFEIGDPLIPGYLYDFQNVFVSCYPDFLQVNITDQSTIICIEEVKELDEKVPFS